MLYNNTLSYEENVRRGPYFLKDVPKRELPLKFLWKNFLGIPVASPIGVPAGPLLTSEWTSLAMRLGYDIVTYKTIRSQSHPCHPLPNILFVDAPLPDGPVTAYPSPLKALEESGITNSFGMPSQSKEFLERDIPKAIAGAGKGQVVVVSVTGSNREGVSFAEDFLQTALFAKECGAQVVEANFSCPNVSKKQGALFQDPQAVYKLASTLAKGLAPIPLIIKVGTYPSHSLMKEVFVAASRAGAAAVSGINTISKEVVDSRGNPALGKGRLTSGICGAPIREYALEFVRSAREIIDKERLPLTLIGVGGVTKALHFTEFLEQGADFVQSAMGMMANPYLANEYHQGV